ncbi:MULTISPECIES: hypothetical protein, partial [unclassified Microcoleus]|uniref:hypothetical protein n=1 Tax=unclassified Microcoleus TaxID=2642155 RepID=UPI002FD1E0A1
YSLLSRMIHFYALNPSMCQLGVRNVGLIPTNSLYKPAPPPQITYINLDVSLMRKMCILMAGWEGAGL